MLENLDSFGTSKIVEVNLLLRNSTKRQKWSKNLGPDQKLEKKKTTEPARHAIIRNKSKCEAANLLHNNYVNKKFKFKCKQKHG